MSLQPLYASLFWRVVLDVLSRGTFFIVNILIARVLGVADYGKFAYAISIAHIFYIFTDLGSHLQLIKELGETRGSIQNGWKSFYDLKLVLTAICLGCFLLLIPVLWHWENGSVPLLALFWMFSNSFLDFNQYVCNGLGRMDLARIVMFIQRIFLLFGALLSLLFLRTLVGISLGLSLGGMAGTVLSSVYLHKKVNVPLNWRWNVKEWKRILSKAIPLGVGGMFGSWYLRVGTILLGWMCTSRVVGEYAASFRIFEMAYIFPAAIMSIAVPHLAQARHRRDRSFSVELRRVVAIMLPMAMGWFAFLALGSPILIGLLYGDRYDGAIPLLRMFGPVGGLVFMNYVVTHIMVIIDRQKRHAVHQFVVFFICVLSSIIFIPRFEARGAVSSILVAEAFLFLLTTGYLIRAARPRSKQSVFDTIQIDER